VSPLANIGNASKGTVVVELMRGVFDLAVRRKPQAPRPGVICLGIMEIEYGFGWAGKLLVRCGVADDGEQV
jgi:hypothetical protein